MTTQYIFLAWAACLVFHVALALDPVCLVDPVSRTCEGNDDKERIFFNKTSGRCQTFEDWRTCTTESNSFSSWRECDHACVCQLSTSLASCSRATEVSRYYFNKDSYSCESYTEGQGRCSINGNSFFSESSCKMRCVCSLSADPGSGDGQESAFFFNPTSDRCEEFTYTGEGGNANRFNTEAQCKVQCQCGMPKVTGPCYANIPRVFYNNSSGQCEDFTYGGCMGNNNKFPSKADCESACP